MNDRALIKMVYYCRELFVGAIKDMSVVVYTFCHFFFGLFVFDRQEISRLIARLFVFLLFMRKTCDLALIDLSFL